MKYLEPEEATNSKNENFALCRAVKLYYVVYGRNAWNSKWIRKYFAGCMNPTFEAAKLIAEDKRVQGSVFYIQEIPALQFINDKLAFIVTEINTESPLQQYGAISKGHGLSLIDAFRHFSPNRPDSVVRLIWHRMMVRTIDNQFLLHNNDIESLETLSLTSKFTLYKSYSNGPDYLLGWNKDENKINVNSIVYFTEKFNNY